jgi:KipI family sensor histidine kinase inhibitor
MRRRPYGPTAWLIEELDDPAAWSAGLDSMDVEGLVELVAAENTVLVRCTRDALNQVAKSFEFVVAAAGESVASSIEIGVRYDGPDLDVVADHAGLSAAEVIASHQSAEYTVAFCGFSPGFAYLRGLPAELQVPRRARPRTVVPAGSVAIAAHYSAIYPSASPGGWHLLGTTDEVVWDVDQPDPARLIAGTVVRFRAV